MSIIGASALLLQANYERLTKDSDVYETTNLSRETKDRLLSIAGPGSQLHQRWKVYVEIVGNGIPFLPHVPLWHAVSALNAKLDHLELFVLDVVDVVVSKLIRFHANDRADIDAMIDLGLVAHDRLIERFNAAVDEFSGDARESALPKYVDNVPETEIVLPSWI